MKGNMNLEIQAPYFSLADFKKGYSNIETLKLITIDGIFTYSGADLKVIVDTTSWESVTSGQSSFQRRNNRIRIALPNPVVPSLELNFEVAELKGPEGCKNDDCIFEENGQGKIRIFSGGSSGNWASQALHFFAKSKDFLDYEGRGDHSEDYWWNVADPFGVVEDLENPAHDASETFKKDKLSIAFSATTRMGGYDKTMFKDISQATIAGLLSKDIVVSKPKALKYAPAHHNFGWEYVVDLSHLQGDDQGLRQELEKLKARYLVLSAVRSDGIRVSLWSDQGKVKDLGLIDLL
jgi:hypothetical protein